MVLRGRLERVRCDRDLRAGDRKRKWKKKNNEVEKKNKVIKIFLYNLDKTT